MLYLFGFLLILYLLVESESMAIVSDCNVYVSRPLLFVYYVYVFLDNNMYIQHEHLRKLHKHELYMKGIQVTVGEMVMTLLPIRAEFS